MKKIRIENSYFTVDCIVDVAVYEKFDLGKYKWYAAYNNNNITLYTYVKPDKRSKVLRLHRLITECPKDMIVDHINGNGLDNRLENLRICTRQQNNLNIGRSIHRKYTSQYMGVSYVPNLNKKNPWMAGISINNKRKALGYFKTELEAAKARDAYAIEKRGQFARLNFPVDITKD